MSEIFKYLIPFATFLLGIAFTLYLKNKEQTENNVSQLSKEIAELTTDWYSQLHALIIDIRYNTSKAKIDKHVYSYQNNRLILPKLLRVLEAARRYEQCQQLVITAEQFLGKLTRMRPISNGYIPECTYDSLFDEWCVTPGAPQELARHNDFCDFSARTCTIGRTEEKEIQLAKYEETLLFLDTLIQSINIEAGRLAKKA